MAGEVVGLGRAVRRRLRETTCLACGHAWEEHPGGHVGAGEVCGECEYERDHGEVPVDRALCRLTVPDAMFARLTPRERDRARPLARRLGDRIGRGLAHVVDAVLSAWP
ncbi:hypothetical protein BIV04_12465 [Frigoribacterium sp. MCBA15_019]|nr:hypothetical protein BIV04_12465 [Frigoribacterium sp. MCBA15_019]